MGALNETRRGTIPALGMSGALFALAGVCGGAALMWFAQPAGGGAVKAVNEPVHGLRGTVVEREGSEPTTAQVDGLRGDVASLRAEVKALTGGLARQPQIVPVSANTRRDVPEPVPPSSQGQRERVAGVIDSVHRIVGEKFGKEPVDRTWAKSQEVAVDEFLLREGWEDVSLHSTVCKSTMCLSSMTFADDAAVEKFAAEGLTSPPFRGNTQMIPVDPDNYLTVELYFARDGHRLPRQ